MRQAECAPRVWKDASENWHAACGDHWRSVQVNLNKSEAQILADFHVKIAARWAIS